MADKVAAAVEIEMTPGYKTYWRSPGESGVPPLFDFAGSENLASAEVLFPAPVRFEDGAGFSNGYHDRVILPLRVIAVDPALPVLLRLSLQYGVCEKLCIPASGSATLALGAAPEAELAVAVSAAAAAVPRILPGQGAAGQPFRLLEQTPLDAGQAHARLRLDVEAEGATLFAESHPDWFVEAREVKSEAGVTGYEIAFFGPKRDAVLAPCPLRLTFVGPEGAAERALTLDACGPRVK